jgi:hypothetical protein
MVLPEVRVFDVNGADAFTPQLTVGPTLRAVEPRRHTAA